MDAKYLMTQENELAMVTIRVPAGCTKTALNFDALDKLTRDLARETFMFVDGKQLLCRSFAVRTKPNGKKVVVLEVMEECFEIVQEKQ